MAYIEFCVATGNIRLGNCRRFTSLTMYNLHIFYLASLMFSSMHDYCFLPCMIIVSFHARLLFPSMHVASGDRFVSFKVGDDHRDDSFFFNHAGYRLAEREESCLIFANCFLPWLLFPSMHVASGDRFISFKVGEDRRDGSFFFYRAGYRTAGREERPKKKSHQKVVLLLVFLVVGDVCIKHSMG